MRGSDFESTIGWVNHVYEQQGIAFVRKVEVPKVVDVVDPYKS